MSKNDIILSIGIVLLLTGGISLGSVSVLPESPNENSIYYKDCLLLNRNYGGGITECIKYVTNNPNATGRDVVYELTATPAEKLLDRKFGQNNDEVILP